MYPSHDITIRLATASDEPAVWRLAALDSARAPRGRVLIAAAGSVPLAARSIDTGQTVADPFHRTADVVEMLAARAAALAARDRLARDRRPVHRAAASAA